MKQGWLISLNITCNGDPNGIYFHYIIDTNDMKYNAPQKNNIQRRAGNLISIGEPNTKGYESEVWCVVDHSQPTQHV